MGLFAVLLTDRATRLPQAHLAGLVAAPATSTGPAFRARVDASAPARGGASPGGANDDAPRAAPHSKLVWEPAALDGTPVDLVAGDRVRVAEAGGGSGDWELTKAPEPHRALGGVLALSGEALRVGDLYPLLGVLRELGGGVVAGGADVPVGMWRTAEHSGNAGQVYDFHAEVPYSYAAAFDTALHPNRELVVSGAAHRVVSAAPHQAAPRIVVALRRMRPGG